MSIESELRGFIAENILRLENPDGLSDTDNLTASGQIDSMSLLQILGFIQERYSVDLLAGGNPKDYESIETLARAVRRMGGTES
jgi:acyl carrier protein